MYDNTTSVTVGGVTYTVKQYKKLVRDARKKAEGSGKKPTKKRRRKPKESIRLLPGDIKSMMRCAKVMRSLTAYYDNGYKQWGNIAKMVINLPEIRPHFVKYNSQSEKVQKTLADIENVAKANSKDVYQFILRLSWQLSDIRLTMQSLARGAAQSGAIQRWQDHECINGEGRRLGLRILVIRTLNAVDDMEKVCKQLETMADKMGED